MNSLPYLEYSKLPRRAESSRGDAGAARTHIGGTQLTHGRRSLPCYEGNSAKLCSYAFRLLKEKINKCEPFQALLTGYSLDIWFGQKEKKCALNLCRLMHITDQYCDLHGILLSYVNALHSLRFSIFVKLYFIFVKILYLYSSIFKTLFCCTWVRCFN